MKCQNCGQEINDGAKFCTYCGNQTVPATPVAPAAPAQQPYYPPVPQPEKKPEIPIFKKWWFWTIIAVIVALIVGIAVFALGSDKDDEKDPDVSVSENIDKEDEEDKDSSEDEESEDADESDEEETEEHDDSYDEYDDGYNYDDSEDFDMTTVVLGEKFSVGEIAEITLVDCYWSDYICAEGEDPENLYGSGAPIEGETYVIVEATIKNLSGTEIDVSNMYTSFEFNDKYTYEDDAEVLAFYDTSNFLTSLVTLKPLKEKTVYFVCSVPDEMYETTETCEFVFGADKDFSYDAKWNGKDACVYLYNIKFTVE